MPSPKPNGPPAYICSPQHTQQSSLDLWLLIILLPPLRISHGKVRHASCAEKTCQTMQTITFHPPLSPAPLQPTGYPSATGLVVVNCLRARVLVGGLEPRCLALEPFCPALLSPPSVKIFRWVCRLTEPRSRTVEQKFAPNDTRRHTARSRRAPRCDGPANSNIKAHSQENSVNKTKTKTSLL